MPDPTHEAMRDLVRARAAAMEAVRRARQQLQGFLLRHGRVFARPQGRGRRRTGAGWPGSASSTRPQQIVLQEQLDAVDDAERRRDRLEAQIGELVPGWSLAPVVEALQALRGVAFITAVMFAAEVGDFRRFDSPRQLMAYLGLVPSERSTGEKVRRGGITKAGNGRARRVLVEGAWTYRFPARVTGDASGPAGGRAARGARDRVEGADPAVRPLPHAHGAAGKNANRSPHRDRARDGRLRCGRSRARSGPRPRPDAGRADTSSEEDDPRP